MANNRSDPYIKRQIELERIAKTHAKKSKAAVRDAYKEVRALVLGSGTRITSKKKLAALNAEIRDAVKTKYGKYTTATESYLMELSRDELKWSVAALDKASVSAYSPKKPMLKTVRASALSTPMLLSGKTVTVNQALSSWTADAVTKVVAQITTGYFRGESATVIMRGVRDVMNASPRAAEATARTLTAHVSTIAKEAVNDVNEGAVRGYILVAVLDSKTSEICRGIDGLRVDNTDDYQPMPPFHFGCRTVQRPWLRADLEAESTGTRTDDDGEKQKIGENYYKWLARQDADYQDSVLGIGAGKIFRSGSLTPEEFRRLTMRNFDKPLTLKELKEETGDVDQ